VCRHIFGLRGDVKDNIHFVEENTIIYPVGHTVVSYNVETKVQRFTPGSPESEGITALAVSPNKKFLAVAERADKGTISVYDLQTLKRRKVLVSSETGAKVGLIATTVVSNLAVLPLTASPAWNIHTVDGSPSDYETEWRRQILGWTVQYQKPAAKLTLTPVTKLDQSRQLLASSSTHALADSTCVSLIIPCDAGDGELSLLSFFTPHATR